MTGTDLKRCLLHRAHVSQSVLGRTVGGPLREICDGLRDSVADFP